MRPPIQSTVTILLLTSLLSLLIPSYPKPTSLITSLLSLLIPSYPKLTSLITFLLSLLIPSYPKPNSLITLIWSLITKIISIIQSTLLVPLVEDIYSVVHCRRVRLQADPGFDESRVDSTSQCCSLGPARKAVTFTEWRGWFDEWGTVLDSLLQRTAQLCCSSCTVLYCVRYLPLIIILFVLTLAYCCLCCYDILNTDWMRSSISYIKTLVECGAKKGNCKVGDYTLLIQDLQSMNEA